MLPTELRRRHCARCSDHKLFAAWANAVGNRLGVAERAQRVGASADHEEYGGGWGSHCGQDQR
jgi:hypothetical protein